MASKLRGHTIYEFGEFRLDAAQLMLFRGGGEVSLPPKAVETLVALIARRGEIVSKDDLIDSIWPDAVVEESNLARYIHVLRSTLGTQPNGKPYIETFRRRGYRFSAEVAEERDRPHVSTAARPFSVAPVGGGAIREATTGNVVTVAEWRREPVESEEVERRETLGVLSTATDETRSISYRRWIIAPAAVMILAATVLAAYLLVRPKVPPLTDKDVILLADFENKTGDEIFDDTLKQALAIQLRESPFLSLFSDERVRITLKLMKRAPDEKVTREVAREICQRQGLKAFIVGSIVQLGARYLLVVEAVDAQTDEVLASELAEAIGREQVLTALVRTAGSVRQKLGESLPSVQPIDHRQEAYTTASLEAWKVLTLAGKESSKGNWPEAIQLAIKAIEIDPEFASAYRSLALFYSNNRQFDLAGQAATKAYALREHVFGQERLEIEFQYFRSTTGEWEKAAQICELRKRLYPRDFRAYGTLAEIYFSSGRFEEAITEARNGIEKGAVVVHSTLATAQLKLGRYDEAKETIARSMELGYDSPFIRRVLVELAFLHNDDAGFENELVTIEQRPYKHMASNYRAYRAMFFGQAKKASEFLRESLTVAPQEAVSVSIDATYRLSHTVALLGKCTQNASDDLKPSSLAYALCGEPQKARAMIADATAGKPNGSLLNNLERPLTEAAIELQQGKAEQAIEILRIVPPNWESASGFGFQHIRGQAYLRLNRGPEAVVEFQKILDHRGEAPLSPLYPLAYLGLARSQVLTGDLENARTNYERFFEIWKDADQDIPALIDARREYARLLYSAGMS